jgi:hypothetical protein
LKKYTLIIILLFLTHFSIVNSQTNLVITDSIKITKNSNIHANIENWYSNETNIHISVIRTDGKTYIGIANLYYTRYPKYIQGNVSFKFIIFVKEDFLYIRYYNIVHSSNNISFGLLLVKQPNLCNNCYLNIDMCKVLWNDFVEYLKNHLMITTANLKYYF